MACILTDRIIFLPAVRDAIVIGIPERPAFGRCYSVQLFRPLVSISKTDLLEEFGLVFLKHFRCDFSKYYRLELADFWSLLSGPLYLYPPRSSVVWCSASQLVQPPSSGRLQVLEVRQNAPKRLFSAVLIRVLVELRKSF